MKKVTHIINWHINRNILRQALNLIPWFSNKSTYRYEFEFTESCKYCESELNQLVMGDDCKDWSKLLGISFFPTWNAQKNSVMLAWRHHPEEGLQVQPYLHTYKGNSVYDKYTPMNVKGSKI